MAEGREGLGDHAKLYFPPEIEGSHHSSWKELDSISVPRCEQIQGSRGQEKGLFGGVSGGFVSLLVLEERNTH